MICLLITFQSSLIHTENTAIFTWLSRHIWIQLHLLWSSYLEATGSYLRNCPDFEKKMTDPGQWSRVRCLETTRTASQAVAPPAGMPLLHLIIKNGKKNYLVKIQHHILCMQSNAQKISQINGTFRKILSCLETKGLFCRRLRST